MPSNNLTVNLQKLSKLAGWFYFVIILCTVLVMIFIGGTYTVMGDSAASVEKMFIYPLHVRIVAVFEVFMFTAVIILSVFLFEITKSINPMLARTAMLLRFGEAMLGYLGIILSLGILSTVSDNASLESANNLPILLYDLKDLIYKILSVCISIGTIIFFSLFYKAEYIPKFLSIWGIVGFGLMLVASVLQVLDVSFGEIVSGIAAVLVIIFELVLGIWLIVKGIKIK